MAKRQFTFICGGDDYIVNRLGRALFYRDSEKGGRDFSSEIVNGRAENSSEVAEAVRRLSEAVQTVSLFAEKKTVWFKDVNFLADSVTGRGRGTQDQVEILKELLSAIDPDAVELIVTACPVDRRRSFLNWCEETADFRYSGDGSGRASTIAPLILEECEALGVKMEPDVRRYLVAKLQGNARLIVEEIRKIATFLGREGGTITQREIDELVPDFGESEFFETVEAFYSFDLAWTLDAIRRHFFANRDARGLITTFQGRNRLMIQLRVLLDAAEIKSGGRSINTAHLEKAAGTYGKYFEGTTQKSNFNLFSQNPWYLSRLARATANLTLKRLIGFQKEFMAAFEATLERPNEEEQILRGLAVRCLS